MKRIARSVVIVMAACALCVAVQVQANAQRKITPQEYIEKYKHLALEEEEAYGIPASIKMAQALLESDCGNSRLATQGNNHFGIKCKKEWTGPTILHDDDAMQECFRKYPSAEESFRDHSAFLDKSPRYASLFTLDISDYKGWAHGLKQCGYATNPEYANLLIRMIERYELHSLGSERPGAGVLLAVNPPLEPQGSAAAVAPTGRIDVDNYVVSIERADGYPVFYNNGSQFVVAKVGDTYESIASRFGVAARKLRRFNDCGASDQPSEGEPVYIKAKGGKSNNGRLMHIARQGETLRQISQTYGIKVASLGKLNRCPVGAVMNEGRQVRLM